MTMDRKIIRHFALFMSLAMIIILTSACTKDDKTSEDVSSSASELSTTSSSKKMETTTVQTTTVSETKTTKPSTDELSAEIMDFIDPIYFNVIFGANSYDDGITENDMKLFAISYIYQYEYEEYKFDTEKFILYIPAKKVEEVVKKYFDVELSEHSSFEDDGILFERGFYLMPAADMNWSEKLIIESIENLEDGSIEVKIMFDSPDGALPKKLLTIKRLEDRFILLGYKNVL